MLSGCAQPNSTRKALRVADGRLYRMSPDITETKLITMYVETFIYGLVPELTIQCPSRSTGPPVGFAYNPDNLLYGAQNLI